MSQAELAEVVGVQPETISRIENGREAPSLARLAALARAIGVEIYELFRIWPIDPPKVEAMEKLRQFGLRLSADEIEMVMEVGGKFVDVVRKVRDKERARP